MSRSLLHTLLGVVAFVAVCTLALFGMALADQSEPFALRVDADPVAPRDAAEIVPSELSSRARLVEPSPADSEPGYRFTHAHLVRRGNRSETIVDPTVVGPFAERWTTRPGCQMSLAASARALDALIVPGLEAGLLPALRENRLLGPTTKLVRADLEFREGSAHFDVAVAGKNFVGASGTLRLLVRDHHHLSVELVELEKVEFHGELRERADRLGSAAGAALAGPLGAAAGWFLVERYVDRKARSVVEENMRSGLGQLAGVTIVPETLELIRGEPRSAVNVAFCDEVEVTPAGIVGRLAVGPVRGTTVEALATPGPVDNEIGLLPSALAADEDLRIELDVDAVNALLDAWAANGLLLTRIEPVVLSRANAALGEWTTLALEDLAATLPVMVQPNERSEGGDELWADAAWGNLAIAFDEGASDGSPRMARVSARGRLGIVWTPEPGELRLTAELDDLWVTCAEEGADRIVLRPCFGAVLEAADVVSVVDRELRSALADLPGIALGDLLRTIHLEPSRVVLGAPEAGVLRLSASLPSQEK